MKKHYLPIKTKSQNKLSLPFHLLGKHLKNKKSDWRSRGKSWNFKSLKPTNQKLTNKDAIPEDQLNEEDKKEIKKLRKGKLVKRKDLVYEINKHIYNFQ